MTSNLWRARSKTALLVTQGEGNRRVVDKSCGWGSRVRVRLRIPRPARAAGRAAGRAAV